MVLGQIAERMLNKVVAVIIPAALIGISAVALYSYIEEAQAPRGTDLPLRVVEQSGDAIVQHAQIAAAARQSAA